MELKTVYTPIKGGFEESYNERKYFNTIKEILKYLITKYEFYGFYDIQQFEIKYYTFSENLKKDRFIIIYRDNRHNIKYPVGFIHYEIS